MNQSSYFLLLLLFSFSACALSLAAIIPRLRAMRMGQIILEIGYDQAEALRDLANTYLPTASVRILRDLGGNDRVVQITLPTA